MPFVRFPHSFNTFSMTLSFGLLEHAEADAFFCFAHLMGEIKDNFLKSLDDSACGIGNTHAKFFKLISKFSQELMCCFYYGGLKRIIKESYYFYQILYIWPRTEVFYFNPSVLSIAIIYVDVWPVSRLLFSHVAGSCWSLLFFLPFYDWIFACYEYLCGLVIKFLLTVIFPCNMNSFIFLFFLSVTKCW